MLFFLRKLAESIVLPIGFCGILIVLAVILRRRRLALAAVLLICLLSTGIVGESLLLPLEMVYPAMSVASAPESDAIVVLAGGHVRGVSPAGLQWGNSANRFFTGVDLARAQKARLFVISSGMSLADGQLLREAAVRGGIARDRIVITRRVLTTADEARTISEIPGIHSILLVTSAFHMPRAVLLFRSRGFDVKPFPTDQRVIGFRAGLNSFLPTAASLENTETALREYYGLLIYRSLPPF
jgi:uncharacterized SAM-binding protein YcdF (DUF218 family)